MAELKKCSDEMIEYLKFEVFTPDKRLTEVLQELDDKSPKEKAEFNKQLVQPLGTNDIRAELVKLIETNGKETVVGDYIRLEPEA